ncbi:unnamed protein product [Macrosiphum euphorbiae]|uniref:Uncharacterized protein n=1 Tax=Macrosiphum euphorbiae TaxID=13131 RepID=A0AAV0XTJ7_9HEMI|nr:unnamed protein product [Macrosiphum euphorbiae]
MTTKSHTVTDPVGSRESEPTHEAGWAKYKISPRVLPKNQFGKYPVPNNSGIFQNPKYGFFSNSNKTPTGNFNSENDRGFKKVSQHVSLSLQCYGNRGVDKHKVLPTLESL